jgi:hypothetical protein
MPKLATLLLATLAACSTMPAGTGSPPTVAPAPATFGPGVYSVTLAESDLPYAAVAAGRASRMVGTWEMAVDASGHAVIRLNGQQVVEMPYQMQGNQLTLAEGTGPFACSGPGRYTVEATAGNVRFTMVQDSCAGRVDALTSRAWTRQPSSH